MSIPIFFINLDRSKNRMHNMFSSFPNDKLIRIKAIDGGISAVKSRLPNEILEPEIACAKSHISVWQRIVDEEIDFAIVLEDDVEPVDKSKSILCSLFENSNHSINDFDVLFLQENFRRSCVADLDSNYLTGWGAHAYAITFEGAKKSINAMNPIILPVDVQWMMNFEKCGMSCNWYEPIKNIKAKVLKNGIIKHSLMAADSTFGNKEWTDDRYKGGQ